MSAIALAAGVLAPHYTPLHLGLLYLPELGGAVITAVVLGPVFDKRELHYLPLVGMAFLAAGIAVFRVHVPPTQALTLVGSALTGIGLGASVAPALFVAGFSLPVGEPAAGVRDRRAAARGRRVHDRPDLRALRRHRRRNADAGTSIALWIGFGLAVGGAVAGVVALRARRCATADAGPGAIHGRRGACLVFAAAARRRPQPRRHRALAEETA